MCLGSVKGGNFCRFFSYGFIGAFYCRHFVGINFIFTNIYIYIYIFFYIHSTQVYFTVELKQMKSCLVEFGGFDGTQFDWTLSMEFAWMV